MLRAARFLHSYLRHPCGWVESEENSFLAGGDLVPATLFRPTRPGPLPGWIVLHGLTVPGRAHPALQRFARSLAGSGAVVLVPEIAAWCELRVDPALADQVIAASAEHLAGRADVDVGGVGVIGFSFGATQALVTAARAELHSIRAVVSFGAYCDPEATFRYAFTGEHEWEGRRYHAEPDPYGRWIVAANYLTDVPEYADMGAVADAARQLASDAGRRGVYAGEGVYDRMKAELATGLDAEERRIWKLVAPMGGEAVDRDAALALGERIAAVAVARHPRLDPRPTLRNLCRHTVLAHGYHDRLIPFTEALRLHPHLPADCPSFLSISRLFAHSREAERPRMHEYPGEAFRYFRLLNQALTR